MDNINDQNGQNSGNANNTNTQFDPKEFETLKEEISSIKEMITEAIKQPDVPDTTYQPRTQEQIEEDIWARFDKQPPKSYTEIRDALKEEMKRERELEVAQRQKYEAEQNSQRAALNKKWDNEISMLEKAGKLPKVSDPTDQNDEGLKARIELFKYAQELGSADLLKVYERVYVPSKAMSSQGASKSKPAGARTPVGGAGGANQGSNKTRSYKDLKSRNIEDVRREYFPEQYE